MCTLSDYPTTMRRRDFMRLRTISETHSDWERNGNGCVFDYYGRVPETVYQPKLDQGELECAVLNNNLEQFNHLVENGHRVHHDMCVGEMSIIEFAAMKGYTEILQALLQNLQNFDMLKQYFAKNSVVEKAYMLSNNKGVFFDQGAFANINRCEAALYTAVVYNQLQSLRVLVPIMGKREPGNHKFYVGDEVQNLSASQLALSLSHMECHNFLTESMSPRS